MSMAKLPGNSRRAPMVEINTTPLVDVMLVLLIIFMITAPLLTHAIRVDLPDASTEPNIEKPETVTLSLDAEGRLYWNEHPIAEDQLEPRLQTAATRSPQPELHLRAEESTRYEKLARILAAAQRAGIERMGFVTEPGSDPIAQPGAR